MIFTLLENAQWVHVLQSDFVIFHPMMWELLNFELFLLIKIQAKKKIKFAKEIRFHTMESLKPCRLHNINSSTQATLINTNI